MPVNWYEEDLHLAIEKATDEFLNSVALWVEGRAKKDMNVDTGFMRNATYTMLAGEATVYGGWESGEYAFKNKAGLYVTRRRAPDDPPKEEHEAAVHSAAEYAIYQEIENPCLYPALEEAAKSVGRATSGNKKTRI